MDITDVASAAKVLGMAEHEISSVDENESLHGPVVHMADGSSYIDIVEPDAKGQTGLAYFKAPCEGYNGLFPVFSDSPATPEVKEGAEEDSSAGAGGDEAGGAGGTGGTAAPPADPTQSASPVPVKGQSDAPAGA